MQFLALIYQNENTQKAFSKEEWAKIYGEYSAVTKELKEKGHLQAGYGLQTADSARTVRSREGRVSVNQGPSFRTEDSLSGVNLIEAPDMGIAVQLAAKIPSARWGSVEVRPLMEYKNTSAATYQS
jgi:hypothetical protein